MSEDKAPKPPMLRVVAPDEPAPPSPAPAPLPTTNIAFAPSSESTAFDKYAETFDASSPLVAAYLTCVGLYLADGALSFYHQAASHAAPGVFRHDMPPGLKSAEATRAWLGTHLAAVKKLPEKYTRDKDCKYARAKDLKSAVALAGSDIDRALATAKSVSLNFDDRAKNLFSDVTEDLKALDGFLKRPKKVAAPVEPDLYLFGCDVLGTR